MFNECLNTDLIRQYFSFEPQVYFQPASLAVFAFSPWQHIVKKDP
jgi:hypothetical protein